MPEIGFLNVAWWVPVIFFVASGHLTNTATTVFLHRCMTHRGVTLHALVSFPMRAWLWLATGIVTKEWVACHRRHHAHVDREGDPHSPVLEGLASILFAGWVHYRRAVRDPQLLEKYGKGTPDDWIERYVFTKASYVGVIILGVGLRGLDRPSSLDAVSGWRGERHRSCVGIPKLRDQRRQSQHRSPGSGAGRRRTPQ